VVILAEPRFAGLFAGEGNFHEIDPDPAAACAPVSPQRFLLVETIQTPQVIDGEKPTNHASVKLLVVPVFPASGYFMVVAVMAVPCNTTSPQHGRHGPRGVRTDYIFDFGEILFQHAAFVVRHLGNVAGIDADAVTGKNAVRRRLLQQRNFRSAQRYWQIRRDIRRDAEAMGVVDHSLDTQTVGQLQRWNVAGLGQRTAERVMEPSNFSS
jgi:hypothetical protein